MEADGEHDELGENQVHRRLQRGYPMFFAKTLIVTKLRTPQYSKPYLEELLSKCSVMPAVNQIENHPSLPQQEIVNFCKEKGIHIMAYSPLGSTGSPLMQSEPVVEIAKRRGVTESAVLLSYHGQSISPRSNTRR